MKFRLFSKNPVSQPASIEEQWPPDQWEPSIIGTRSRQMIGGTDDYTSPPKDDYRSFLECATWIRKGQQLTSIRDASTSPKAQVWLNLDSLIPSEDVGGDVLLFEEQEPIAQAVLEHIVTSTYERINIVNRMLTEYRDEVCGTSTEPAIVKAPTDLAFEGPFPRYRWQSGTWVATAEALGVDGQDQDLVTPEGIIFVRGGSVVAGTGAAGRYDSNIAGSQHISRYLTVHVSNLMPPRDWNRELLPVELVSTIEDVLIKHVVDGHAARQQLVRDRWASRRRVPTSEKVVERDAIYRKILGFAEGMGVQLGDGEAESIATYVRRQYDVDELRLVESELLRRGYRLRPRDDVFNLIRSVARDEGVSLGEAAIERLRLQLPATAHREQVAELVQGKRK